MTTNQDLFTQQSLFRRWCVGIVTADKPEGTNTISVFPVERLPLSSGKVGEEQEQINQNVGDSFGTSASQSLLGEKICKAQWFPNGDNHLFTAPMVRKNESVQLYRYADSETIFWTTIYLEPSLRRLERIIWGSGNLSSPGKSLDLDSIYYLEFDTIRKVINIKTSNSDGERIVYHLSLNPGQGEAFLQDDKGNRVFLDSSENKVMLEDAAGGRIDTTNGVVRLHGPNGVFISGAFLKSESPTTLQDGLSVSGTSNLDGDMNVSGFASFPGGHS